jgi:lysophospholipid acyltransferase (LPLAT)-like uncharacterized protein
MQLLRSLKKNALNGIIFRVIYWYYLLLKQTCRFQLIGFSPVQELISSKEAFVFATPHCSLLPCILGFDGFKALFLASLSGDGTLITKLLKLRGFEVIQGSSSRGGVAALFALRKGLSRGLPLGITFDGPRGPPFVPKPGVVDLAFSSKSSGCFFIWIKPCGILAKFLRIRLSSWDRFILPLPFWKFEMHFEKCDLTMDPNEFTGWLEKRSREVYQDHFD